MHKPTNNIHKDMHACVLFVLEFVCLVLLFSFYAHVLSLQEFAALVVESVPHS